MRVFHLIVMALLAGAASLCAQSITGQVSSLGCTTSAGSNTFVVQSWSSGVSNTGTPNFSSVSVTKNFDECSAALFKNTASGQHFTSATLTQYDKNNTVQMTIQLTGVTVVAYHVGGTLTGAPAENVSFNYTTITITDTVSGAKSCWSLSPSGPC